MHLARCAVVCAVFLLAALPAVADVVGPEPNTCPPGSTPGTCHAGPHCRLEECSSDDDCATGQACEAVSVCRSSVICAGLVSPDADLEQYRVQTVEGLCSDESDGSEGSCEEVRGCVDPGGGGGGKSDDGCAVVEPGAGGHAGAWLPLAALGLCGLALRRRARARVDG